MEQKNEKVLDIEGISKYVFANLKGLIIFIVIGALIGLSICIGTNKLYVSNVSNTYDSKALVDAREDLSEVRIKETEQAYKSYKSLTAQKDSIQSYMKNSILLNLSESSGIANTIVYTISNNNDADSIVTAYTQIVKSNFLFDEIKKKTGMNTSSTYLSELIEITDASLISNNSTKVDLTSKSRSQSFVVTVYGKNEKQCQIISSCVKKQINNCVSKLVNSYGKFNLKYTSDTYGPIINTNISNIKMDYESKLTTVLNSLTNLTNSLSVDEQTYFNALIDNGNLKTQKSTNIRKSINFTSIIVYGLGVAFLFFILYLVYRTIRYMTDHKIHTEKEFISYFGIDVIATVNEGNKFDENVALEEINFLSKKLNNADIGLLSSLKDNKFEDELEIQLSKNNVHCIKMSATPETKEEFDKILNVNKVIIVEKLYKSTVNDLEKMLRYYELKGINILGAIIIR